MEGLQSVLAHARACGLLTIWDSKRNDIASTAAAYADAGLSGTRVNARTLPVWDADAMTVNPYLGRDSVQPFLESARSAGRGVFILVRTSNPSAGQFQDLKCGDQPLFLHVADAVAAWAREDLGRCGFGSVGAVVGATYPAELAAIRRALPHVILLLPGFGAQGASAADTAPAFRNDGWGAMVSSSRAVTFPFDPEDSNWETAIENAAQSAIDSLAAATPMGRLRVRTK
jgi:orotidine-5'-phosphate decarboxylase